MRTALVAGAWALLGLASSGAARPSEREQNDIHPAFRTLFAVEASRTLAPQPYSSRVEPAKADATAATFRGLFPSTVVTAPADPSKTVPLPVLPADRSIAWLPLLGQSLQFMVFQHSVRIAFEEHTWERTAEGPFWDDYVTSMRNICCWDDNDKWTTDWLFHPLLGSSAAFVFANNHRDSQLTPPGLTSRYWSAKGKQGVFAAIYSTYFELGPVLSESAIGNVGLDGGGQTWHDIVITPVMGTLLSVGEDVLRVSVIDWIDRRNHFWGATSALFLNPTRSFANLMAWKTPWADPPWLTLRRRAGAGRFMRTDKRVLGAEPGAGAIVSGPRMP